MIPLKCHQYSQISSGFKDFFNRFFGKKPDCQKVHLDTYNSKEKRVHQINVVAPDCCCEASSMSEFSPSPIKDEELVARFVFSPLHVNKRGDIKPSVFSHIYNRGCSIQRETKASNEEINSFLVNFLSGDAKRSWSRVLLAKCGDLRKILIEDKRALCLYDTASEDNPAHGEICVSREIPEADQLELRHAIKQAFSEAILPNDYRNSMTYEHLSSTLKKQINSLNN